MRKLLSTFALFIFVTTSISQTPKKVENWQTFSPQFDEFSVETPMVMSQDGDNEPKSSRKFYGAIDGVYVYVFSDPVKTQSYYKTVRDILGKIGQSGDVLPEEVGTSDSVSFKDTFGYWHSPTTLRTETRVYTAQTVTLEEKNEVASHFIKSFGIRPRPQFVQHAESAAEPKSVELKVAPVGQSGGQGSGRGSGSGTGSGSSIGVTPVAPASGQTSGMKILSKARPSYTDMARFYVISGTVMLRVTFLGSGEIGSITAVTKAPFGLTERAVDAARRITFEPAYRNGSPQAVSKQIEYSFSIY